ncbi:AAA family ATPase [Magnetospirillum fulvum]|nr:P-loop NTPase [Magnetospirillum fulvum]
MDVISKFARGTQSIPKNVDFIAVMADDVSVSILEMFVLEAMIPHAFVFQGSVNDLISMLANVDHPPEQLVVDVSKSAMPHTDLANLANVCPPGVSVVVVGERNDIGLFRELLRMGVDDYIVKPLTMDLLHRVMGRLNGRSEPVHQIRTGKLVACLGSRGGVGTSTVAANMGWRLARDLERRVAVIDLDPFGGSLDILLGSQNNKGLADLLKNINQLDPHYVERSFVQVAPRLFLLSARYDLGEAGVLPAKSLNMLLVELKKLFHYVILDLPCRGGEIAASLVNAAETVVVVTEPSVISTRETVRLLQLAELRDTKVPVMVVVNQPNQPGRAELRLPDFEAAVGRRILHVLPFDRDAAGLGENIGPPVVAGKGPLAQAMRRLVDDLAGRHLEANAANVPFWRRLPALGKFLKLGG